MLGQAMAHSTTTSNKLQVYIWIINLTLPDVPTFNQSGHSAAHSHCLVSRLVGGHVTLQRHLILDERSEFIRVSQLEGAEAYLPCKAT